jgi:hypothetical protein
MTGNPRPRPAHAHGKGAGNQALRRRRGPAVMSCWSGVALGGGMPGAIAAARRGISGGPSSQPPVPSGVILGWRWREAAARHGGPCRPACRGVAPAQVRLPRSLPAQGKATFASAPPLFGEDCLADKFANGATSWPPCRRRPRLRQSSVPMRSVAPRRVDGTAGRTCFSGA